MHTASTKSTRFLSAAGLLFAAILAIAGALHAGETADESLALVTGNGKSGSAFVVALQGRTAFLATAKHVVEGQRTVTLTFSVDRSKEYVGELVQKDASEDLALLRVADAPAAIRPLAIVTDELLIGEDVLLAGFPRRTIVPRYSKTALSSREGSRLVFYEGLDSGNSGGPVLNMDSHVVGLVVQVERHYSKAIPSATLRPALASWLPNQLPAAVYESSARTLPGPQHAPTELSATSVFDCLLTDTRSRCSLGDTGLRVFVAFYREPMRARIDLSGAASGRYSRTILAGAAGSFNVEGRRGKRYSLEIVYSQQPNTVEVTLGEIQ